MTNQELAETLHKLSIEREFRQLRLATDEHLNGFEPERDNCHGNVDRWISLNPQHRAIRGFLVVNDYIFNKHSVVDTGTELLDITPRPLNESRNMLSFIVMDGDSRAVFDSWPNQVLCQF